MISGMNVIGSNTETKSIPIEVAIYSYKAQSNNITIYVYDNINGRKNAALYSSAVIIPAKGRTGDAVIESAVSSGNTTYLISNIQARTDIVFVSGGSGN